MRAMSAEFLEAQRKAAELEKAAAEAAVAVAAAAAASDAVETPIAVSEVKGAEAKCSDTGAAGVEGARARGEELATEGGGSEEGGEAPAGGENLSGGYVEFLPVEWFSQVREVLWACAWPGWLVSSLLASTAPTFLCFVVQLLWRWCGGTPGHTVVFFSLRNASWFLPT